MQEFHNELIWTEFEIFEDFILNNSIYNHSRLHYDHYDLVGWKSGNDRAEVKLI